MSEDSTTDMSSRRLCPKCDVPRIGNFRFCTGCGFDFDAGDRAGEPSRGTAQIRLTQEPRAPRLAVSEQRERIRNRSLDRQPLNDATVRAQPDASRSMVLARSLTALIVGMIIGLIVIGLTTWLS